MDIERYLSLIIIGVIWFTIICLWLISYFCRTSDAFYVNKVYDKCTSSTTKYRYIIRFVFKSFKSTFEPSKTTISVEIWNKKNVICEVKITPEQLTPFSSNSSEEQKTIRLLLCRSESFKDISYIVITHNGSGEILVSTVEVQNITETMANIAFVGNYVSGLSRSKATVVQKYGAATQEPRIIESTLREGHTLSLLEYIPFFILAVNLMVFLTVYLIFCPKETLCNDYRGELLSSVLSGLSSSSVAAIVFMFSTCFYRYIVKQGLVNGWYSCRYISYGYLFLMIGLGIGLGIFGAVMASEKRKFPFETKQQKMTHEMYWMFAFGISLTTFFLFWISLFSTFGYFIGFFTEPEYIEMDTVMRTDSNTGQGSDYVKDMIKTNAKVKSISHLGGLQQKAKDNKQTKDTKPVKKADTETEEDIGQNYYAQLMKGHEKVKSVSQYKGLGK